MAWRASQASRRVTDVFPPAPVAPSAWHFIHLLLTVAPNVIPEEGRFVEAVGLPGC